MSELKITQHALQLSPDIAEAHVMLHGLYRSGTSIGRQERPNYNVQWP